MEIYLDDYIPSIKSKPAFSHSDGKCLWVILLEKAWAKINGNYKMIEKGFPEEILHGFTGAPIKNMHLKHNFNE